MDNNIVFRTFKEGDYELCCEWWKWWWDDIDLQPIRRGLLPKDERCYIIEKNGIPVACTFLLLSYDVPGIAWTTYLVSNPKYKEKDRRHLIGLLVSKVEEEAERYGVIRLFTVCGDKHMADIHQQLDWHMVPVRFEAFKTIQGNIDKLINNNHG
tara:strand:- start:9 stop:470 length:462 start_codon:yes stop_codon:yes gene_type:complete